VFMTLVFPSRVRDMKVAAQPVSFFRALIRTYIVR
jgi:hypothetical protein